MITVVASQADITLDFNKKGEIKSHVKKTPKHPALRKETASPKDIYEIDTKEHDLLIIINIGHIKMYQDDEDDPQILVTGTTCVLSPNSTCTLKDSIGRTNLSFLWIS